MPGSYSLKLICVTMALLLVASNAYAAPYADYDNNVRDLLEFLMQRDSAIEDRLGLHQVVRKAGRSPQLRLRFGKRPDPAYPVPSYMNINEPEQQQQ